MTKLKNIEALSKMMAGTHRTQTRKTYGYSDVGYVAEKAKLRSVGEIWEEIDAEGKTVCWWKQEAGFRMKYYYHPDVQDSITAEKQAAIAYLKSFHACPKAECTCKSPTRIDEKFRRMTGMCEDCVIGMETKLKMSGKFGEYAVNKMKANADSFFRQADGEVEVLKREISNINYSGDESDPNNPIEKWSFQDAASFNENIDAKYAEFKSGVYAKLKGETEP